MARMPRAFARRHVVWRKRQRVLALSLSDVCRARARMREHLHSRTGWARHTYFSPYSGHVRARFGAARRRWRRKEGKTRHYLFLPLCAARRRRARARGGVTTAFLSARPLIWRRKTSKRCGVRGGARAARVSPLYLSLFYSIVGGGWIRQETSSRSSPLLPGHGVATAAARTAKRRPVLLLVSVLISDSSPAASPCLLSPHPPLLGEQAARQRHRGVWRHAWSHWWTVLWTAATSGGKNKASIPYPDDERQTTATETAERRKERRTATPLLPERRKALCCIKQQRWRQTDQNFQGDENPLAAHVRYGSALTHFVRAAALATAARARAAGRQQRAMRATHRCCHRAHARGAGIFSCQFLQTC